MLKELGVEQITIPLPFRLNHVNCFLAQGENGWTIIDAGLKTATTARIWQPILETHDIQNIIITHHHPDHFGYAGTLQQLTNAQLSMSEIEAQKGLTVWKREMAQTLEVHFQTFGFPNNDFSQEFLLEDDSFVQPYPTIQHYLEEGQVIPFGKYEYEVLFTPGHADGLITLYNKEQSILFSTDHILPKITPNISYWLEGRENPLGAFFSSLEKIRSLDVNLIIPSHGQPFQGGTKRIEQLLAHHQERLAKVYECIKEPTSIYEVNAQLFHTSLSTHDFRFAIGETISHLEYLYHQQQCQKTFENGTWYYQAI
jgi:glyoxylase-like metal-dependent hydrolase (beta-lactamase superfamily II)